MEFDVINLSREELNGLNFWQMKQLRTAQQEKNELERDAEKQWQQFREKVLSAGMKNSTLLDDKRMALDNEVKYKCAIIADNLIYNLGIGSTGSGDYSSGYLVDYSLSYIDRYIIVRDYYLAITDRNERLRLYSADEVAKRYLGGYYETLFNVLATYDK